MDVFRSCLDTHSSVYITCFTVVHMRMFGWEQGVGAVDLIAWWGCSVFRSSVGSLCDSVGNLWENDIFCVTSLDCVIRLT